MSFLLALLMTVLASGVAHAQYNNTSINPPPPVPDKNEVDKGKKKDEFGTGKVMVLFRDVFDLSIFSEPERRLLTDIPVLKIGSCANTGHLNRKQISLLKQHFNYDNGVIRL